MNPPIRPNDELDGIIADAMRSRPVPAPILGLASRAMDRARHRSVQATPIDFHAAIGQRRRATTINAVAACILIGLLLVFYFQLDNSKSYEYGDNSTSPAIELQETSQSSELLWGFSAEQWGVATAAMLIGVVAIFGVELAMSDGRIRCQSAASTFGRLQH